MRIKKFNESINTFDVDYLKEVFADLIDDGASFQRLQMIYGIPTINIRFVIKKSQISYASIIKDNDFDNIIKLEQRKVDILNDLNSCISRIKENTNYHIVVKSTTDPGSDYHIIVTISEKELKNNSTINPNILIR